MKGETKSFLTFDTFDEAMNLHKRLFEIFNNEHLVTYADVYYVLKGTYKDCPYDYYKYGWTSLMESKVRPCDDGRHWSVILPEPKHLAEGLAMYITDAMDALACNEVKQGMRDLKKALLYLYDNKNVEKENE